MRAQCRMMSSDRFSTTTASPSFRARARAGRRVAVVVALLGGVDLLHIQVRDEAQTHLQRRPQLADHALNFVLHRIADEHVFYVVTDE